MGVPCGQDRDTIIQYADTEVVRGTGDLTIPVGHVFYFLLANIMSQLFQECPVRAELH